jgi:uncharacterized protein (DUF2062 family)
MLLQMARPASPRGPSAMAIAIVIAIVIAGDMAIAKR